MVKKNYIPNGINYKKMIESSCEKLPIGLQLNNNVVDIVIPAGGKTMPIVNALLDKAKAELSNLLPGEVFLVRDLFKGYAWNRISRSDRLLLGTLFLNYVKTDNIGVVPIEKTSSGQQRYMMR